MVPRPFLYQLLGSLLTRTRLPLPLPSPLRLSRLPDLLLFLFYAVHRPKHDLLDAAQRHPRVRAYRGVEYRERLLSPGARMDPADDGAPSKWSSWTP